MAVTLVSGGVRSGKSRHAEALLRDRADVTYVACGRGADPADPEWQARLTAHRLQRPTAWTTVETRDLAPLLGMPGGPLLVECLGTWLTGIVDDAGLWEDLCAASEFVAERTAELVRSLSGSGREVVLVTNEVGLSLVPLTPAGRFFQDELGRLNAAVADHADHVHLVVAGRVLDLSAAPRVGS